MRRMKPRVTHELERSLGLYYVTGIVMGAIIGVGIFFTPSGDFQ